MADTNALVKVNVRIEGKTGTKFEDNIDTQGGDVTPGSGTTHPADGTNGNEYPFKVPTCTAALARSNVGWDGTFNANLEDFFITKIAGEAAGTNEYWQLAVNFKRATLGGGQTRIQTADSVVWALIPVQQAPANGLPLLKLKGPRSAKANVEFQVTVIDGETRQAVEGATVKDGGGQLSWKTDYQGVAKIKYPAPDTNPKTLKAEHKDKYVRSNALKVKVD
ncbi:hypothetical protein GALMADRAFT_280195 [Galerina marginata CBS 339.88]|uniref:Transcobalamin-like C-terminal domain-containing protein n=1 Tax=Galerina marginata (strain CBS 339.88) TaxID=685588 RepID=A0A067T4K3_GALM3|nr:hypothetical protein GALMADRAFT_280195 [Galerina marginata CBS 339.88]